MIAKIKFFSRKSEQGNDQDQEKDRDQMISQGTSLQNRLLKDQDRNPWNAVPVLVDDDL